MWNYNYNTKTLGDDELMHFKYLKRYRSGDKWRYVYADNTTHNYIKSTQKQSSWARDRAVEYRKTSNDYRDMARDVYDSYRNTGNTKLKNESRRYDTIADDYRVMFSENMDMSMYYSDLADSEISKHSVSTLSKNAVDKGISFVSEILNKLKRRN